MTMTDLHIRVAAPTVAPRPFGLFSVVTPTSPPDPHWAVGVQWDSWACASVNAWVDECITGVVQDPATKVVTNCDDLALLSYKPFTVYAALQRSQIDGRDAEAVATVALTTGESFGVETGLWALMVDAAGGAPLPGGATALDALAVLEQDLAENYHGLGVIHLTPSQAIQIGTNALVTSGSRMTTILGTPVVVGAGYDNTDDLMFASGVLNAFRSAIDTSTGYDLPHNDITVLAERTYVVGWDCYLAAATITAP